MASILILSGPQRGKRYPLGRRPNVVGRAESLFIQILDKNISRKHLHIRYDSSSGHYFALDMHSRNGVILNDLPMTFESVLFDGDRIRIGNTHLLFTERDSDDEEALHLYKRAGERNRKTYISWESLLCKDVIVRELAW